MDIPDLNQNVVLVIALLASLNRLVRLTFLSLRLFVREYRAFRVWLRTDQRAHDAGASQPP
jgi:hypothetical protein